MKKRLLALVLVLVTSLSLLPMGAEAMDVNDSRVFAQQQTHTTCTLASAAMMLRRKAVLDADSDWWTITEGNLRKVAWTGGLAWNFTYHGLTVSVKRKASGWAGSSLESKRAALIDMLADHPEGIVAYAGNQPHAVLLTDYDADTGIFYCCDPAPYYFAGRVPLTRSSIKGGDQNGVLSKITQLWYISSGVSSGAGTDLWAVAEAEAAAQPQLDEAEEVPLARDVADTVDIDGQQSHLQLYALTDEAGNDVNYVNLRDLAKAMNGTAAQFDVCYDGTVALTTSAAYEASGEDPAVFTGDQSYTVPEVSTTVDGVATQLGAIQFTDESGGGYIYYNLRDLGQALGFQVNWDAERGICLETSPWTFTTLCRLAKSQSVLLSPSSLFHEDTL